MNRSIFILVMAIVGFVAFAQQPDIKVLHQLNKDALKMVADYQSYSTMDKPRQFNKLFESDNIQIYNDLLGISEAQTLSVKEYQQLLSNEAKYPSVVLRNLKKKNIYKKSGKWYMELEFEKELNYTNSCGILFSAQEFYGSYHVMTMTLAWNDDLSQCYIVSLQGTNVSKEIIAKDSYEVIIYQSKYDKEVEADGEKLSFNSFDQALIKADAMLTYPLDADMTLTRVPKDADCHIYSIKYSPKLWRLKFYGNFGLINPFAISSSIGELLNSNSKYIHMGVDCGYVIPVSPKFQVGFFSGLGVANSGTQYVLDSLAYNYEASSDADYDGDEYQRYYLFRKIRQNQKMLDLSIPLYFDLNVQLMKWLSIYADVGIRNNINLSSTISNVEGTYETWGVYKDYGYVSLDYTTGLNQFVAPGTEIIAATSSFMGASIKKYSLDLMTNIGMRFRMFGPLLLDCNIGYQHSFICPNMSSFSAPNIHSGEVLKEEAFSTYTLERGEQMQSLMNYVNNFSHRMFTFSVGLMIKL